PMKMFRIALLVSAVVSLSACAHTDDRSAPAAQPDAKTAAAATAKPAAPPSADAVSCPVRGEFDPASGFFSQFYEDYILAYVLHDRTTGTFVDVGANDPNINNVTKYFYQKGWRCIDVEPNPDLVKL